MHDVTYGQNDGIQETPIVGMSTDESQNLWVATPHALYLLQPGQTKFTRYDSNAGLHFADNPITYCDRDYAKEFPTDPVPEPDKACPISGAADPSGISEIVGGGPNEVFVGYNGTHNWSDPNDGTWTDKFRHTGMLDRVRLNPDGKTVQVDMLQMLSGDSAAFWHNRDVMRMVYDHFKHPHELYVGTNHGITRFTPDKFKPIAVRPGYKGIEIFPPMTYDWMSDHLHPQACYHHPCGTGTADLRLGDWRGLAIAPDGDLWVAGRWAAGKIVYVGDNSLWFKQGGAAYARPRGRSFGDPYDGNCSGNPPVFCVPLEGDIVNLSAVTVATDGRVWFANSIFSSDPAEKSYGIAAYDGKSFTYFDPVRDAGMSEVDVRDMVALPDGRLVFAGPNSGIVFWDPKTKMATRRIRAGTGLPSDRVSRLELDTMVDPPVLHVSTDLGATSIRIVK
jgi:ligand-binding sensor domain-containing protein